jgi:4-carboxymuconolactone decarboxylase
VKGGVPPAVIDAIRNFKRPKFDHEDEEAVYDYAAELNATHFVREATHRRARGLLGVVGVVELTALVGYYSMVAATLNAHELLPPPEVAPPLPPRG